jgi:hypothetical protein
VNDEDRRTDVVMDALGRAPRLDLDAARVEQIRARCQASLAARGRARWQAGGLEPVLVTGLCAIYLAEVARRALQLLGL